VRLFIVQALVLTIIALVVSSVFFRSSRARRTLDYIRDAIVLYVLAVLALGLFTYFRQQF
jgi:steroid 5-alpha reductase family enzyme